MSLPARLALFGVAAAFAGVFYINFCDLVYQCGCRSIWNGLAEACNIHHADTHDCPWCSFGRWGYLPLVAIVVAQAAIALRPGPWSWRKATWTFLQFPLVGGLGALAFGWVTGYWS